MFVREKCQSLLSWHSDLSVRPRANGAASGFSSGQQPGGRLKLKKESLPRQKHTRVDRNSHSEFMQRVVVKMWNF